MEIKERQYDSSLNDTESANSRALRTELNGIFSSYFRRKFPRFKGMVISNFFRGRVGLGVRYKLSFLASSNVTNTSIVQVLRQGNRTANLAFLTLGGTLPVTKLLPITLTTTPGTTITPTGLYLSYFFTNILNQSFVLCSTLLSIVSTTTIISSKYFFVSDWLKSPGQNSANQLVPSKFG